MEGDEDSSLVDDKDELDLLNKGESLELVEFDPMVDSGKTWEAGDIINTFLTKYFTKALDQREIDNIMEDFLKPNCPALQTPNLDEKVKKLVGKDPHFGTERALYKVQDQILNLAEPLTSLWSDLFSRRAKVST